MISFVNASTYSSADFINVKPVVDRSATIEDSVEGQRGSVRHTPRASKWLWAISLSAPGASAEMSPLAIEDDMCGDRGAVCHWYSAPDRPHVTEHSEWNCPRVPQ